MKLKAVIALALATVTAPVFSADQTIASRLTWAFDVGTHIYDIDGMASFKPSLELGIAARLPLTTYSSGELMLEVGGSQTAIYGSSELDTAQIYQGNELKTAQIDIRRVFVSLGFETTGKWFFKPQVGLEHTTTKLRLYDENTARGFTTREGDSNAFAAFGVGYRFPEGKKGILSLATLADNDDQDFRLTFSASL